MASTHCNVYAWMISGVLITTAALPAIAAPQIATPNSRLDSAHTSAQPADFWQAVNAGSLPHVKRFTTAKDINARDALGQPALMIAAGKGYGDVVAWLIDQGADINITGPRNWTPLIAAAFNNHTAVAKQLLAHKADTRIKSNDGFDALFYAIEYQHTDVLKTLIDSGADLNSRLPETVANGHTALMHASQHDTANIAKILLQKGVAVDATDTRGQTALFYAAQHGSISVLEALKQYRANINATDQRKNTALHAIAERGDARTAQWLIDNGSAINAGNSNGDTALTLAAFAGNTDMATLLFKRADAAQKNAAWFAAIRGGALPTVTALADAGIDINARNAFGETALMTAAQLRHAHIVTYLIEHKADVNATDPHGNNALLHAAQGTPIHAGVVQQLLDAGCDPARANDKAQTARAILAASSDAALRALAQNRNAQADKP